jgi:epoxyqueuosine reductase
MPPLATALQDRARALGFTLVGLAPAQAAPTLSAYFDWLAADYHGEMGYLAREDRLARRRDLNKILPGVKSLILVGLDYASLSPPESVLRDPLRGRIANYAWGLDYHAVMTPRLQALGEWLADQLPQPSAHKVFVDTGALLERAHAQQAGLGFIGKNTLLIHPKRGSYLFLGVLLTTYEFEAYDEPQAATQCGACTRCLVACPTQAFPRPYVLDARRCISYLTIELKGEIPLEVRPMMGNWVYGCDICQEVCPYVRRFTQVSPEAAFQPLSLDRVAPPLHDLLTLTPAGFEKRFRGSAIERIKYERLLRNACIAAGNAGDSALKKPLEAIRAQAETLPLAAAHAEGALERL